MRVFVYEYLCAGGAGKGLPASLLTEGWAMLSAVLADLGRVAGVHVDTILTTTSRARGASKGSGLPSPPGACAIHRPSEPEDKRFRELAAAADGSLIIAPEFDDLLGARCRWAEEAGGRLLGPSAGAVRLTGDKRLLASHLHARGVPTPPVLREPYFPAVWKPRFGAGSQATFLVHSPEELAACPDRARAEGWRGEAVVQPYVPGLPASVALLLGPRQQIALPAAAQELSPDGRFCYRGGAVPLPADLAGRAAELAARAVQSMPGLRGYVGVDLVLGGAADGSGDCVIEINPRLTTSYVGLRALAETNLAEAMLDVATGGRRVTIRWRPGGVRFRADGFVSRTS